jgi:[ribosomal protein S5]-alanine N-acetyltransferase
VNVIETPRLRLEPLEARHASLLFEGLRDQALYMYIDDTPPTSVEALTSRYEMLSRTWSPDGKQRWLNWAVFQLRDRAYIGYVQATVQSLEQCEIAFVFFRNYWGKGFASEAVQAMLLHLAEGFDVKRVTARTEVSNLASRALLSRLAFELAPVTDSGVNSSEEKYQKRVGSPRA